MFGLTLGDAFLILVVWIAAGLIFWRIVRPLIR